MLIVLFVQIYLWAKTLNVLNVLIKKKRIKHLVHISAVCSFKFLLCLLGWDE